MDWRYCEHSILVVCYHCLLRQVTTHHSSILIHKLLVYVLLILPRSCVWFSNHGEECSYHGNQNSRTNYSMLRSQFCLHDLTMILSFYIFMCPKSRVLLNLCRQPTYYLCLTIEHLSLSHSIRGHRVLLLYLWSLTRDKHKIQDRLLRCSKLTNLLDLDKNHLAKLEHLEP
jgi:hypothetical protein